MSFPGWSFAVLVQVLSMKWKGAMSHLMAAIVKNIFCREDYDPALGILLPSPAPGLPPLRLFFSFQMVLQDGASQKATWCSRGWCSFEILSSLWCENSAKAWKGWRWWCCCGPCVQLGRHENFLFRWNFGKLWHRLAIKQSTLNKEDFLNWQKACGLTWQKNMFCLDETLRSKNLVHPKRSNMHMTGCTVVSLMVPFRWSSSGFSSLWEKNLGNFLKTTWNIGTFPSTSRSASWKLCFLPKKVTSYKKQGKFSCQASEAFDIDTYTFLLAEGNFSQRCSTQTLFVKHSCGAWMWFCCCLKDKKSCLTTKQNLQAAVAKCFAGMVSAGWHKNHASPIPLAMAFWRWTCTPWKMHCMFCYRKKAQGAEKNTLQQGRIPSPLNCLAWKRYWQRSLPLWWSQATFCWGLFDKGASTYKEACSIPHQDFWNVMMVMSSALLQPNFWQAKHTKVMRFFWRACKVSPQKQDKFGFLLKPPGFLGCLVNMFKLKQYKPFYWLSCVGGHKPKSFGSVGRCCGTNDLLPTCRRASELCCHGIGTNKKALEKETQMSLCRLLQN